MLLRSLRLHPFAGFASKAFDFAPGLNVLLGPNEAGKSTVINALFGVLQLAEKPVGFDALMKELYLPKTGGDFFRVTLEFEAENEEYELTWKLSGKTSLELANRSTGALFDQDALIRQKLTGFKTYHHDVYQDVLVIRQGGLDAGNDILSNESFSGKGVDQLLDRLRQRTVAGGGFSPEAMLRRLDVLLGTTAEGYAGRWDERTQRPEGNRGIENPWRNEVGLITQAYYGWKRAEKERVEVEDIVRRLERITAENEAARQKLDKTRTFLEERRAEFESRDRLSRLMPELERWEQARKSLQEKQAESDVYARDLETARIALAAAEEGFNRLKAQEADMAKAKVLTSMKETVEGVQTLKADYLATNAEFKALPEIKKEKVQEAKSLDLEISRLDATLQAVQLSLQAEAISGTATIWLEDEKGVRTEATLSAGKPYLQTQPGRVLLETGSVRIQVQPEKFNAEAILKQKEEKAQAKEAILNLYIVPTTEELETKFSRRAELESRCRSLTDTIKGLTNKPEYRQFLSLETVRLSDLETVLAGADLDSLPDPRSFAVDFERARGELDRSRREVRRLQEWMDRNPADKLKAGLNEAEAKARETGERARHEAWFGKDGEADLLDRYRKAQSELVTLGESLAKDIKEMAGLEQQLDGKPDLNELRSHEAHEEAKFRATLQEFEAYKTIRANLVQLMGESDTAVYGPVRDRLARNIGLVTGSRYALPEFEGSELVPERFVRGRLSPLNPEHLSQGTNEAISLATRLALAEFYLEGRKGFLILDDAMVNMDPERMVLSAGLIQDFASRFQVIYCTCHPAHAEALGGNRLLLDRMA